MSNVGSPTHRLVDDFVAPPCDDWVQILYQDEHILLIDKPSGLLSLSGKNPQNWDSVHHRLVHGRLVYGQAGFTSAFPEAKLPHRLDLGTSGVMVVALNAASAKHLNQQFQAGTIQKRYLAMLEGWVTEEHGQISGAIAKDAQLFPRVKLCPITGKVSLSEYQVLRRLSEPKRTLVQFTPRTGRTHQLRIHSLSFGHPILGCDLYQSAHSEQLAARLLLHASDLYFVHPANDEAIHGHSPCPF
ncbi:RluA family pseudouridine synthase [Oceanisphaera sp. IT1-181]|uniref:RluA family pseudouridine synthase n=1 Tax=Oceanisphaera sp. IT1-181 TaxID=3081199 RepID=UPI0029CA9583|nr:RluA family pseudouridine synthase [Oceanisphaera sp. IT1-181]